MQAPARLFLVSLVTLSVACANSGDDVVTGPGPDAPPGAQIDRSRLPPTTWKELSWNDPGGWRSLDVTQFAVLPNQSAVDATPLLSDLLVQYPEGALILQFPEGTFTFKTSWIIQRSNVIVRGAGRDRTRFVIDTPDRAQSFIAVSGIPPTDTPIPAGPVLRGEQQLTVQSAGTLGVGDYLLLYDDEGRPEYDANLPNQIVAVTAKDANRLTLDMRVGVDLTRPKVVRLDMAKNVGFEDLSVDRLREGPDNVKQLVLNYVQNGFVRNCRISRVVMGGIAILHGRDVLVQNNEVHDYYGAGGGNGSGIMVSGGSTNVHLYQNRGWNLRHHFLLGEGANHCVVAYNKAEPAYDAYGDINIHHGVAAHNNLLEGNDGVECTIDGVGITQRAAYWNTFFRNHCRRVVGNQQADTRSTNVIANETDAPEGIARAGFDNYVGANRVAGAIQWGVFQPGAVLQPSLYASGKPPYVAKWPLFGP